MAEAEHPQAAGGPFFNDPDPQTESAAKSRLEDDPRLNAPVNQKSEADGSLSNLHQGSDDAAGFASHGGMADAQQTPAANFAAAASTPLMPSTPATAFAGPAHESPAASVAEVAHLMQPSYQAAQTTPAAIPAEIDPASRLAPENFTLQAAPASLTASATATSAAVGAAAAPQIPLLAQGEQVAAREDEPVSGNLLANDADLDGSLAGAPLSVRAARQFQRRGPVRLSNHRWRRPRRHRHSDIRYRPSG